MTHPSNTDGRTDGRRLGLVARDLTREKGYVFLRDQTGEEYFAHARGFSPVDFFESVKPGDAVSFKVSDTPKGVRARSVRAATAEEAMAVAEWAEARGNK